MLAALALKASALDCAVPAAELAALVAKVSADAIAPLSADVSKASAESRKVTTAAVEKFSAVVRLVASAAVAKFSAVVMALPSAVVARLAYARIEALAEAKSETRLVTCDSAIMPEIVVAVPLVTSDMYASSCVWFVGSTY